MLNLYYQVSISLLTPLKLKIKHCKLKKLLKEPPNLNFAESSEVKSIAFLVSLCYENFKN